MDNYYSFYTYKGNTSELVPLAQDLCFMDEEKMKMFALGMSYRHYREKQMLTIVIYRRVSYDKIKFHSCLNDRGKYRPAEIDLIE